MSYFVYVAFAAGVEVRSVDNTAVRGQQVERLRKVRPSVCTCARSVFLEPESKIADYEKSVGYGDDHFRLLFYPSRVLTSD